MTPRPEIVRRPMTPAEWAMLLALSGLWGGSFFLNAVAVRELPVLLIVVARVGLGALLLLAVLRLAGQRLPRSPLVWRAFLGMGLLNNAIPFSLIIWGQTHVASGVASILNASTPLFGVVFAHVLTDDDRMTPGRLAGVLTGFAGVAVMIGMDAVRGLGAGVAAQLAFLAAAVSYALASIYGRRFRAMGVAPMVTATGQLVASTLLLAPVVLLVDRPWTLPMPGADTVAAVLALAALCTALAYVIYFRILATAGATNILLVTLLVPVSAVLLGTAFLGETLAPRQAAGMVLIALGLAAIDGRPLRGLRRAIPGSPGGRAS